MASFVYVDGDHVNENIICCICRMPFLNPVTVRACRHTFCRLCITQALANASQCPVDRSRLHASDLTPADPVIRNLVEELLVECLFSSRGCNHTGPRYLSAAHMGDCGFAPATCGKPGCDLVVYKKDLDIHMCGHWARCTYCDCPVDSDDLEDHQAACLTTSVNCPDCFESLPTEETVRHHLVCPSTVVSCHQAFNGCLWSGPRASISEHMSLCAYEAVKGAFAVRDTQISELKADNAALWHRTSALEGLVSILQHDMQALKLVLGPWCQKERALIAPGHAIPSSFSTSEPNTAPRQPAELREAVAHPASTEVDGLSDFFSTMPQAGSSSIGTSEYHRPNLRDDRRLSMPLGLPAHLPWGHHHQTHPTPFGYNPAPPLSMPLVSLAAQVPSIAPLDLGTTLEGTLSSLRDSVISVAASVDANARRMEITQTADVARNQEDIGAMRATLNGLRMQVHSLMADRNARIMGLNPTQSDAEGASTAARPGWGYGAYIPTKL